jgi:hypothetical protein
VNDLNEELVEDHDFDMNENYCNESDNESVGSSDSRNSKNVLFCNKRT